MESCSSWHGRFHYIFSLRDLSRVFQGICQADPQVVNNAAVLVRPNFSFKHSIFSERRCKVHFDSLPTSAAGCGVMNVRACMKIDSTRMATRRQRSDVGCHACRRQFCHLQHAVSATRLSSVRSSYTTSSRLNFRRALGMHLAKPVEWASDNHPTNNRGADVALQDPLVWGDFRDALDILVWELRMEQKKPSVSRNFRFAFICLDVIGQTVETLETGFRCVFSSCFRLCRICFCFIEGEERHTILRSKSLRGDCNSDSMPLTCWHLVSMKQGSGQLGIHAAHLWWSSWAVQWKLGTFSNFLIIIRLPW